MSPTNYRVEVDTNEATWSGNGLVFNSEVEAREYGRDLQSRWTQVRRFRVVPETWPKKQKVAS